STKLSGRRLPGAADGEKSVRCPARKATRIPRLTQGTASHRSPFRSAARISPRSRASNSFPIVASTPCGSGSPDGVEERDSMPPASSRSAGSSIWTFSGRDECIAYDRAVFLVQRDQGQPQDVLDSPEHCERRLDGHWVRFDEGSRHPRPELVMQR